MRDALGLDARERSVTREEIQGFLLNALVGLGSVGIANLGGEATVSWAGWIYVLILPVQIFNGRIMAARRKRL